MLAEEHKKNEVIDGVIYDMSPSADYRHGTINLNIYRFIKNQLEGNLCMVFAENLDYKYDSETDDYVIPDVMIICDRNHLKGGAYRGVPRFIVETVSPSTVMRDKVVKKEIYERCGVEEYWIILPLEKMIEMYVVKNGRYVLEDIVACVEDKENPDYNADREIVLKTFPHVKLRLGDIFEN